MFFFFFFLSFYLSVVAFSAFFFFDLSERGEDAVPVVTSLNALIETKAVTRSRSFWFCFFDASCVFFVAIEKKRMGSVFL